MKQNIRVTVIPKEGIPINIKVVNTKVCYVQPKRNGLQKYSQIKKYKRTKINPKDVIVDLAPL